MVQKIYGYIQRVIWNLTEDEDIRQELWVYILEGNSPLFIKEHFLKIRHKMEQ